MRDAPNERQRLRRLRDGEPLTEEFTAEDVATYERRDRLYQGLSEDDRLVIVTWWDDEQGLELPITRLEHKRLARELKRRRKVWTILALLPALAVFWWFGNLIGENRSGRHASFVLDQLVDQSKNIPALKSAIADAEREYRDSIEH